MTWTSPRAIERLVKSTCWRLGHDELHVRVVFDRRLVRAVGVAYQYDNAETGVIRLAARLWDRIRPADRRETIIHEVCHLTSWIEDPIANQEHCPIWFEHMAHVGYLEPHTNLVIETGAHP